MVLKYYKEIRDKNANLQFFLIEVIAGILGVVKSSGMREKTAKGRLNLGKQLRFSNHLRIGVREEESKKNSHWLNVFIDFFLHLH